MLRTLRLVDIIQFFPYYDSRFVCSLLVVVTDEMICGRPTSARRIGGHTTITICDTRIDLLGLGWCPCSHQPLTVLRRLFRAFYGILHPPPIGQRCSRHSIGNDVLLKLMGGNWAVC